MRRICLFVGLLLTGVVAEAQAAAVYEECATYACRPVFVAARGEANDLRMTSVDRNPDFYERFQDRRAAIVPIGRSFSAPTGAPAPDFAATLRECTFTASSATCRNDYIPLVYLGDKNDVADVSGGVVYGEAGNDTVRAAHGTFIGGSGGDTLSGGALFQYSWEPGVQADLHVDMDGVADDGRPGEGDNVLPGIYGVSVALAGNHTLIGSDGDDFLDVRSPVGSQTIDGRAGNDHVAGSDGNDTVTGGDGRDIVLGRLGDDVLTGGPGRDDLGGSLGDDVLYAQDGEADMWIDCSDGLDTAYVDAVDPPAQGCENVIVG